MEKYISVVFVSFPVTSFCNSCFCCKYVVWYNWILSIIIKIIIIIIIIIVVKVIVIIKYLFQEGSVLSKTAYLQYGLHKY